MELDEVIHQFAERFSIDVLEIVDDAVTFDADGTATVHVHQA